MKALIGICLLATPLALAAEGVPTASDATEECLACHATLHPGIVAEWKASRHAAVSPAGAMAIEGLGRKVSSGTVREPLRGIVVGCAECHTARPDAHADTFDHNGHPVHVVVSPDDCAVCHAVEADQYSRNVMSFAHGNLEGNALYQDLERNIQGVPSRAGGSLSFADPEALTEAGGCLYCHGTKLKAAGTAVRETVFGEMAFPVIEGWPNQGVGRINLDGSRGSCAACHTRHAFSIETARQPYTCKECHVGPDVPVFKVYSASKHGNIFHTKSKEWDFEAVPWTVGSDFTAPTCAACHVSLLVDGDGEVVAERTHAMSDRIARRIFGLVYSHPQPKSPDTTIIRNKDGLPLATALDGTPASAFLIGAEEQAARRSRMERICLSCHATSWVAGHFEKYEAAHRVTNEATAVATGLLQEAWNTGLATGPGEGGSPFDEAIERTWMDVWLFHANSIRFSAAMAGGGDYSVFAAGHYELAKRLAEMQDWLEVHAAIGKTHGE